MMSATRPKYVTMSKSSLSPIILFVVMGISLLIFVAVETGASEPLLSKLTCASAAIPALRQRLLNRCLAMDYSVTI
jgi:hypothetical protein